MIIRLFAVIVALSLFAALVESAQAAIAHDPMVQTAIGALKHLR